MALPFRLLTGHARTFGAHSIDEAGRARDKTAASPQFPTSQVVPYMFSFDLGMSSLGATALPDNGDATHLTRHTMFFLCSHHV
jgi:hypothetical protein